VYFDESFYPLDSAMAVLRFRGLPFIDRMRLGMGIAYLRYVARWESLEKFTAHDWLQRWVGKRAYRILWEPLLIGKFGQYYKEVNMAWFWARVKARTPRLGTYEGGFQAFMDAFADRLRGMGVDVRLQTPVERIELSPAGGLIVRSKEGTLEVDRCLVTTSPAQLAEIAPDLPKDYLEQLLGLKSMGAVVMVLALKHQLSEAGIYWHNMSKEAGFPFLSLVEHTNFLSPEFFGGEHIVYVGDYLDVDHEYFRLTKDQLLDRFLPSLARMNPAFSADWIRETWLFRSKYAQPVPPLNHSTAIPDIRTPLPGLWFASMSQVYPWDRGTNYAVEIARRAVKGMLSTRA
jgi:protoporphyrinogen oxidase